ncbi:terminase [Gordonia phage Guey18]|nr:terminase [Gordonia phage Guey18]
MPDEYVIDSYGDEAAFLVSKYGLTPDPWQKIVLDDWLAYRADMKWAASRCGLSVPRQNGKNGLLEMRELFGLVGLGEKILHTSHLVATNRKAFVRLASFFENERKYPELAALLDPQKGIRRTNGQEAIFLTNGASIEFVARSRSSARGFTIDLVVMDEAQEMDDDHLEALLPTTAAAPLQNRQLIWTGTPPDPELLEKEIDVFLRQRDASLAMNERRCWHEWHFPDDMDYGELETWCYANPAAGIRLGLEEIAEDYDTMSEEGFARERGGIWGDPANQRIIPIDVWRNCFELRRDDGGEMSIAVDMSQDRQWTSLVSVSTAEGIPTMDLVDYRSGPPEWVCPRILEACRRFDVRCVVIDGASTAAALIEPLRSSGIEVTVTSAQHMKRAAGMFLDGLYSKKLLHINQPSLTTATEYVRKRKLDDGFAWRRKDNQSDISPVVAATLAYWGLLSPDVKRPIKRRGQATFV